jgi:HAT1-interacting factor 1
LFKNFSSTKQCGEDAPETADLYFYYGKALLENAITQSSVLGKEQHDEDRDDNKGVWHIVGLAGGIYVASSRVTVTEPCEVASGSGSGATGSAPIISFAGDGDEDEEPMATGEDAVDMFEEAIKTTADEDADGGEEEEEDGEPEDDFNAAWEVLDLARSIYDRQKDMDVDDKDEVRLKLADTYIALGDVSLETGASPFSYVVDIPIHHPVYLQRNSTRLSQIIRRDLSSKSTFYPSRLVK